MTAADWISAADQIPAKARITLTGGEPLLFRGFDKVFTHVANRHVCNLITNGLLLDPRTIDFLLGFEHFKVLAISIDNIGNTTRGVTPRQWKHLEEMVAYFSKARRRAKSACTLDIKTVILDETADQIFSMYRYFKEVLGCESHSFQFLKGSPLQHADVMLPLPEALKPCRATVYRRWDTIVDQLEQVRRYNIKNGYESFLHPPVASLFGKKPLGVLKEMNSERFLKNQFAPCKFPWSSVHINYDGTLFPCLAIGMGNVKTQRLKEIIFGKTFGTFKTLVKKEGLLEACNRCGWLRCRDS
jgi:radical SAM protein with 4Fe4S-binding SPASM domain